MHEVINKTKRRKNDHFLHLRIFVQCFKGDNFVAVMKIAPLSLYLMNNSESILSVFNRMEWDILGSCRSPSRPFWKWQGTNRDMRCVRPFEAPRAIYLRVFARENTPSIRKTTIIYCHSFSGWEFIWWDNNYHLTMEVPNLLFPMDVQPLDKQINKWPALTRTSICICIKYQYFWYQTVDTRFLEGSASISKSRCKIFFYKCSRVKAQAQMQSYLSTSWLTRNPLKISSVRPPFEFKLICNGRWQNDTHPQFIYVDEVEQKIEYLING